MSIDLDSFFRFFLFFKTNNSANAASKKKPITLTATMTNLSGPLSEVVVEEKSTLRGTSITSSPVGLNEGPVFSLFPVCVLVGRAIFVGCGEGAVVGVKDTVGKDEGAVDGFSVGTCEGTDDGLSVGFALGTSLGALEGATVGDLVSKSAICSATIVPKISP